MEEHTEFVNERMIAAFGYVFLHNSAAMDEALSCHQSRVVWNAIGCISNAPRRHEGQRVCKVAAEDSDAIESPRTEPVGLEIGPKAAWTFEMHGLLQPMLPLDVINFVLAAQSMKDARLSYLCQNWKRMSEGYL